MKEFSFKINIDNVPHYQKPDKEEIKKINFRIAKNENFKEVSFNTFCEMVGEKGHSFLPGYFKNETRNNENWEFQFCFAIDIDDGETIQEAVEICNEYNIMPSLIYTTFSHTEENHRFRLVWFLNEIIDDVRVQRFIQLGLMRFFKGTDKGCKDKARMFNGGNRIVYKNENNFLTVPQLFISLNNLFRQDKNATKNTLTFARQTGINIVNGYLDCKIAEEEPTEDAHLYNSKSKKNKATLIYNIYYRCPVFLTNYIINFTNTYSTTEEQFEIEKLKMERELVRNFDFDILKGKCKLFENGLNGTHKVEHNEMFGMFTNLLNIKGSEKYVKDVIDNILKSTSKTYEEKYANIENTVKQIKKVGYKPMSCCNFCPYYGECESETNMITYCKTGKNQATKINTFEKVKEIEEIRQDLKDTFEYFFKKKTTYNFGANIVVVKAPTGIGKTETFINSLPLYDKAIVYAAPTHKLIKDVAERLKDAGYEEDVDFMCYPELPKEFEGKDLIEKLYAAGAHKRAMAELQNLAKTNEEIKIYLEKKKRVETFNKIILITHNRLIYSLLKTRPLKYVVDEDVFLSTMFPVSVLKVQDLVSLVEYIENNCPDYKHLQTIKSVLKTVLNAENELYLETPKSAVLDRDSLAKCAAKLIKEDAIDTNVLKFFSSSYYVKNNDYVTYINKNNFNFTMEADVIILSATVNQLFTNLAFPYAQFIDLGQARYQGTLYQVPTRSLSRACISKNKEGYENYCNNLCKKYLSDYNTITFPEFLNETKTDIEKQLNLWNCVGLDGFQNKDLAIIGTPHCPPDVYYLMARVLGLETNNSSTEYRKIQRNGFEFYFNSYSGNDALAEIQLYLIESVLMQAVGRARLVNNENRKVLLLSNLMLPQATVFNYSNKAVKELME